MGKKTKKKEMPKSSIGGIIMVDDNGIEKRFPFELTNYEDQPREIYSNHVIINNSPTEYNLFFTRINPIISKNQAPSGKSAKLEVVARITLPPKIIPGIIKALENTYKKFEEKK